MKRVKIDREWVRSEFARRTYPEIAIAWDELQRLMEERAAMCPAQCQDETAAYERECRRQAKINRAARSRREPSAA